MIKIVGIRRTLKYDILSHTNELTNGKIEIALVSKEGADFLQEEEIEPIMKFVKETYTKYKWEVITRFPTPYFSILGVIE